MKNLTEILQENKTSPSQNNGWSFEFDFIQQITNRANQFEEDFSLSMEQVDLIMGVLFELAHD